MTLKPYVIALAFPSIVAAQFTAGLRGQVHDPSGAVVPRATVTVTGPNDAVIVAQSDDAGNYRINGLAAGRYTVRASAPGFALFEAQAELNSGRIASLDVKLTVALDRQEVTVVEDRQVGVEPAENASATTLKDRELDVLSDNPDDLESDLLALAGPTVGPNGGQIFVDGFSNGQLPPKEAIREIRINSDPFSAEYDRVGNGRIEILTKPGADKLRGSAAFFFADSSLNSRNPFSTTKPDTQMRRVEAELGGPLNKKTSYNLDLEHAKQDQAALINALILDDAFQPVRFVASVPTPNERTQGGPRVDYAITPNITLGLRYYVNRNTSSNNGIGNFSLLSRAVTSENTNQNGQVRLTVVMGAHGMLESRFQYRRSRSQSTGDASTPTISVQDAFTGGGASLRVNYYHSDNFESHNTLSYSRGRHYLKTGVRIRGTLENGFQTSNFNGTFTFNSIDAYAIAARGAAQGLTFDEIRAQGGAPSQYSAGGGNPLAGVGQMDAAPFVQDDWKVKPNFTLSPGLRYETQTNIGQRSAWAPRLGMAWGIGKMKGRANQPRMVLRGGIGLFYDRFSEGLSVQAERFNGTKQQAFLVLFPDFFPVAPPVSQLVEARVPQTIRKVDSTVQAPRIAQFNASIERQFPRNITVSLNLTHSRGVHQLRSRNINAPLPGTYTGSGTGVFPYGNAGQLYLFESTALFKQTQVSVNVNARVNSRLFLFGYYGYGRAFSSADGAGSFPADSYNAAAEWSRASFDVRHYAQIGGNITTRFKIQFNPQINVQSAPPFNITLGRDLNGDALFLDRPSFATDLTRPSVRVTPFGVFDTSPIPGQTIIPRNYGEGFGSLSVNLRVSRTWSFGEPRGGNGRTANNAGSRPGRYNVTLGVQGRNVLNTVNPASPNGNLSSQLFGQSLNSQGSSNANRRLELQARFQF